MFMLSCVPMLYDVVCISICVCLNARLMHEDLVQRNVEFVVVFEGVIQTTGNVLHTRTS